MKKIYKNPQIQTVKILDRSHLMQGTTKVPVTDGDVVDKHEDLLSREFTLWDEETETNSKSFEDNFDDFKED